MDLDASADAFLRTFSRTVCRQREHLGLFQETLSFESEPDRTYISGIERGVRNPTVRTVSKVAVALKTTPAKLFLSAGRFRR